MSVRDSDRIIKKRQLDWFKSNYKKVHHKHQGRGRTSTSALVVVLLAISIGPYQVEGRNYQYFSRNPYFYAGPSVVPFTTNVGSPIFTSFVKRAADTSNVVNEMKGFSHKSGSPIAVRQPELNFIEQLSESCETNPVSCDVLSYLAQAELDYMTSKAEERLLNDVAKDMEDVNDELILSRAVRSPEGDLNRLVAQTRNVKMRLRKARRMRGNYGLKFKKFG